MNDKRSLAEQLKVYGIYNGRKYRLIWRGFRKGKMRALLGFVNGQGTFFVDYKDVTKE